MNKYDRRKAAKKAAEDFFYRNVSKPTDFTEAQEKIFNAIMLRLSQIELEFNSIADVYGTDTTVSANNVIVNTSKLKSELETMFPIETAPKDSVYLVKSIEMHNLIDNELNIIPGSWYVVRHDPSGESLILNESDEPVPIKTGTWESLFEIDKNYKLIQSGGWFEVGEVAGWKPIPDCITDVMVRSLMKEEC